MGGRRGWWGVGVVEGVGCGGTCEGCWGEWCVFVGCVLCVGGGWRGWVGCEWGGEGWCLDVCGVCVHQRHIVAALAAGSPVCVCVCGVCVRRVWLGWGVDVGGGCSCNDGLFSARLRVGGASVSRSYSWPGRRCR